MKTYTIKDAIVQFVCALTKWWLQHASVLLAVSNWLDLGGVYQAPEVVLVVGPIQAQPQTWSCQAYHCGNAGGCGVSWVLSLQLHPCLELIIWRCEALCGDDRLHIDDSVSSREAVQQQQWRALNRNIQTIHFSCLPVWSRKRVQQLHLSLSGIFPNWNDLEKQVGQ